MWLWGGRFYIHEYDYGEKTLKEKLNGKYNGKGHHIKSTNEQKAKNLENKIQSKRLMRKKSRRKNR